MPAGKRNQDNPVCEQGVNSLELCIGMRNRFNQFMRMKACSNAGFTLVEIMIVVAIIGLIGAIAIPNLARARGPAQANTCISNLREMDAALQEYAMERRLNSRATYVLDDLKPYMRLTSIGAMPVCPGGGQYLSGLSVKESPTCSLRTATPPHMP